MKKYVPYRHRSHCLECGCVIDYAKSNQKFCSDSCRDHWHYKENKKAGRFLSRVMSILETNRSILIQLTEEGRDKVEMTYLESRGFRPGFCTGFSKRWGYSEYRCFDIKYCEKNDLVYNISSVLSIDEL